MNPIEILNNILKDYQSLYNSKYDNKINTIKLKYRIGYDLIVGKKLINNNNNELKIFAEIIINKEKVFISTNIPVYDNILTISIEIKERLALNIISYILIIGLKSLHQNSELFHSIINN
jgi:hypothetical protein